MATLREKLEKAQANLQTLVEVEALLNQLHLHHGSLAKPQTQPASKTYNKELADRCLALSKKIRELG